MLVDRFVRYPVLHVQSQTVIASIWARTVSVVLLGAHGLGSETLRAQVARCQP